MAAIRPLAAGISCSSTWVMRASDWCSMPLATDSSTAFSRMAGATRAAVVRIAAAGTAKMTSSSADLELFRISGDLDLDGDRDVRAGSARCGARPSACAPGPRRERAGRPARAWPCAAPASCPTFRRRRPPDGRCVPRSASLRYGSGLGALRREPSPPLPPFAILPPFGPDLATVRLRSCSSRARSRMTSRSGVPSKPNASRSRFSR